MIYPEYIVSHRQSEGYLAGSVCGSVEAGVGAAVKGIHVQSFLRRAVSITNCHNHRYGHNHRCSRAAWYLTVIYLTAPELDAVQVGSKSVVIRRQGQIYLFFDKAPL